MPRGSIIACLTSAFLLLVAGNAAAVNYSPSSLTFAKQNLGTISPPQAVTVSGGGCGPDFGMPPMPGPCYTEPTDIAVSGPFGITANGCPNPLYSIDINNHPPCSISVAFYPTAKGEQKGFLRLVSSPSIVGVPLDGVGCQNERKKQHHKKHGRKKHHRKKKLVCA